MSNLDDILSSLGIGRESDPVTGAIRQVAASKIAEAARAANDELSNAEQDARIAALQARADDSDAEPLTMAEAGELARAERITERDAQEAAKRDYEARGSKAARTGKETPEQQHRTAWAAWFMDNGKGQGIAEPKIEDFQ